MKLSTGLRNALLSGSSLKGALDGGEIRIYSGVEPTTADDAIGAAVLLCTIRANGNGLTFAQAVNGVMLKNANEVWSGVNSAAGTATFYRHVPNGDNGAASASSLRIQGTVGLAGADINLTSTGLIGGASQSLNFYSIGIPA